MTQIFTSCTRLLANYIEFFKGSSATSCHGATPVHPSHSTASTSSGQGLTTLRFIPVQGVRRFPCEGWTMLRIRFQTLPGFLVKVLSCKNTDVFGLQIGNKRKNIHKFFLNYHPDQRRSAAVLSQGRGTHGPAAGTTPGSGG